VWISWPTAGYHVALRSSGGVSQLRGHLHVRQHAGVVVLGAGAAGGFTGAVGADAYKGVKAACQAAVKKFRDQPSGPDEEGEYMHQLVAEALLVPVRLGISSCT
jgi:hypothetical protein